MPIDASSLQRHLAESIYPTGRMTSPNNDNKTILLLDKEVQINPKNREAACLLCRLRLLAVSGFYQQLQEVAEVDTSNKALRVTIHSRLIAARNTFLSAPLTDSREETLFTDFQENLNRIQSEYTLVAPQPLNSKLNWLAYMVTNGPTEQIQAILKKQSGWEQGLLNLIQAIIDKKTKINTVKALANLQRCKGNNPQYRYLCMHLNWLDNFLKSDWIALSPLVTLLREKDLVAARMILYFYRHGPLKVDITVAIEACTLLAESSKDEVKPHYQQLLERLTCLQQLRFDEQYRHFDDKTNQLYGRNQETAFKDADKLRTTLTAAKNDFLDTELTDNPTSLKKTFLERCQTAVTDAKASSLKDHRGWGDRLAIFLNTIIWLLSLGQYNPRESLERSKAYGFFRKQTDSLRILESLDFKEPPPATMTIV
jgi:hypothetical protein